MSFELNLLKESALVTISKVALRIRNETKLNLWSKKWKLSEIISKNFPIKNILKLCDKKKLLK